MDLKDFKESLDRNTPPKDIGRALQALWHQAKGGWETAHRLAQSQDDGNGAWVNAFLHRVKGDTSNGATDDSAGSRAIILPKLSPDDWPQTVRWRYQVVRTH